MAKKIRPTKSGRLTGYRLHDARLAWAKNGQAIRTIKYPINGTVDVIAKNIAHDYKTLFGPRNISDVLAGDANNPTILELLVLAANNGFVFASKSSKLSTSWQLLYPDAPTPLDTAFSKLDPSWQAILDKNAWYDFINTEPRPNKTTKEASYRKVLNIARVGADAAKQLEPIAIAYAEYITKKQQNPNTTDFDRCSPFSVTKEQVITASATYSFVIDTNYTPSTSTDSTYVMSSALERFGAKWEDLLGISGSSEGINSFLGKLINSVNSGEFDATKVVEEMATITLYSQEQKAIALDRLTNMEAYIKALPPKPRATKKGWENYRTYIGGQIKSWGSNYLRQKVLIRHQISEITGTPYINEKNKEITPKSEIAALHSELQDAGNPEGYDKHAYDKLLASVVSLQDWLDKTLQANSFTPDDIDSLRDYIATIRSDINYWWQAHNVDIKKPTFINKKYPKLFTELYRLPKLPGEAAKIKFLKYVNFVDNYQLYIKQLNEIIVYLAEHQETTNISIQQLEQFRHLASKTSTKEANDTLMVVAKYCGIDTFGKYSENQRFYINPRSRDKRLARIVYDQAALPYSDNFTQLAFKILNDITDPRQVLSRLRQTIEHLEILKTITAILVINYREETIIIEPKDDKQKQFIAMASADNSLDKFVLGKFMQTLVFAEIKGLLSLVSKQRYIARYVISTSDDSDYRLLVDKATIDTGSTNWTTKAKFYLAATVGDISKQYSDKQYVEFIKPSGSSEYNFNEKNAFKTTQSGYHYYSINSTSRYHKQFLWWLLVKPKHKHNKLGFMSPSIIAEEIITLNWTNGILTAKTEDSSTRVHLALPLYLAAENAKENEHYAASTNKIIGVDVGEKGLAYVVAKRTKISKGYNLEIVEKGFLRQAEHDILASKVKQLRARQVLGVFGESDTYVARLRKKLIDAYRSQLDSLALKHSARLSFEASISGFETGGNKIKKIYASLKKSAVPAGVEADKSVVTHYWGAATRKAENHIGSQIVAAGTSQRCSKCKRWSSRYINDNVKYEVSEVSKGLGSVMLLDGEKLMIFSDKVLPTTIDGQELKKLVYAFMRPPLDSAAATYVSDVSGNVLIKELLMNKETWIKNNANSAIYICPYEKCLHVSDADIQAALNIAIRGFIKFDHGNKKQSEESGQDYDTVLNNLKMQEELYNYPEIELNIQSRL